MPMYQAPKLNQIAPNKRAHRWNEIHAIELPFAGDPAPDHFGFWFNYFWSEARLKPGLTEAEKSKLCEMFFSVFEGAGGGFAVQAALATKEDAFKENILRQILLIGFRRVAVEPPRLATYKAAGGRRLAPPPLRAIDAAQLNWETAIVVSSTKELKIGFRADTRSYDDLVLNKGFNARARQDGWVYTGFAFNQRWNPFSNPVYSQSLFLRLGAKNKDACLYTVVSAGANFREVAHFPILNDYGNNFKAQSASGHPLAVKPAEMWNEADILLAAADRMRVRAVKSTTGPGVDHVEKDNHIHVFHTTGLHGFNTQAHFAGADSFPERSMREIPLANLLADIHFIQKWWYRPDSRQLELYELEFSPIRWVPSEQVVEQLVGAQGMLTLKADIDREITRAKGRTQDVVPNGLAYRKFQIDKVRLPNALELVELYGKLQDFIRPIQQRVGKYAPNGKAEKAAMIIALPLLAAKINLAEPAEWSAYRTEAIRRMS
jgi:hypothetical protein